MAERERWRWAMVSVVTPRHPANASASRVGAVTLRRDPTESLFRTDTARRQRGGVSVRSYGVRMQA